MAPSGFFCMSGPVAHADDDDESKYADQHMDNQSTISLHSSPLHFKPKQETHSGSLVKDNDGAKGMGQEGYMKYICSDGMGKIFWPSGAFYNGEVMDGNLHGVGTYTGADGTVYQGNWILNKKHGFGRKMYENGDVYEGFWKLDVPEGQGRYFWSNGSEYIGDWRSGMMCGIGVLKWVSGDSYDGQWLNGLPHGHGIYTWADGNIYVGAWIQGSRCGVGRFCSPGRNCKDISSLPGVAGIDSKMSSIVGGNRLMSCDVFPIQETMTSSEKSSSEKLMMDMLSSIGGYNQEYNLVCERPRMSDTCGDGFCKSPSEVNLCDSFFARPSTFQNEFSLGMMSESESENSSQQMECGKRVGEYIRKGHRNYSLVLALQLGIRYSIMEGAHCKNNQLFPSDFGPRAVRSVDFCRDHSQSYHVTSGFEWTDYCPAVFRNLRKLFKVESKDYMSSICESGDFRELPSPGKSGCVFYLSQDELFMIKTLRKAEVKMFLKMLPEYYNHVCMYKNTLLTKFFGLHCVKLSGGQKVRFMVMGNIVSSDSQIHKIFDLKGSSDGRTTNKSEIRGSTIFKDLDLDVVFHLDPCSRERMLEQIRVDCKFLESQHIMDYSLLLGIHFKDQPPKGSSYSQGLDQAVCLRDEMILPTTISKTESCSVQQTEESTAVQGRKSSVEADAKEHKAVERTMLSRNDIQIGMKMHAKSCQSNWKCHHKSCTTGHEVVLYMGIIDILQEYDWSKKLEHAYKSIQSNPLAISAVDPTLYSMRFQHFLHQIFVLNNSSLQGFDDS